MNRADQSKYVGRFAPSPTGPLHFGSLVAAVASYLDACQHNGKWLLRIEDIDPPRAVDGADRAIIKALETYGFQWSGPVCYQSRNRDRHIEIIDSLIAKDLAYQCSCSRSEIGSTVYPGTCRKLKLSGAHSVRMLTDNSTIEFIDGLQGPFAQQLETDTGDFVIRRRDGLVAYQLAVVVDDFDQGITDVVRGLDLIDSTPRQIHLQRALGLPIPAYKHTPLVLAADKTKLSKTTGAEAISLENIRPTMIAALKALWQEPPEQLADATLENIWDWAKTKWNTDVLKSKKAVLEPS